MSVQDQDLKLINYHGRLQLQSKIDSIGPYFSNMIQHRINTKRACNIVFTGEPGISKSYMAIDVARNIEGLTASGKDRFSIDQVVFTYQEFMDLVLTLKQGKIIVFDEPSYAMGKREWYKDLNKALVQTMESFRFKVHPLFIPIVNKALLDKTIRDYLLQYQVHIQNRGKALVYQLRPSQFMERIYHEFFCELVIRKFDNEVCQHDSCLDCKKIMKCPLFYAQYERKKALVQDSRYASAREAAGRVESKMLGISELETLALPLKDKWLVDDRVHVQKLRLALADAHGIQLSLNRAYQLRTALEEHNIEIAER